jgi:hypothetical protein
MGKPGFGRQQFTRAETYGLADRPWPLRDLLVARRMVQEAGLGPTLAHTRAIVLSRLVWRLSDRRLQRRMPAALGRATPLQGMQLRTVAGEETFEAEACAAIPRLTFRLALRSLGIDPRRFHFVDVGSGWGYALLLAAQQPFRHVTGIEFARELHERAVANMEWAGKTQLVRCGGIDLRHESALETELPQEPLLLFLFNPFGAGVMAKFLDRVDESRRRHPRPIIAIYVHPLEARLFDRPGVAELTLRGPAAMALRLVSPSQVRAWQWRD